MKKKVCSICTMFILLVCSLSSYAQSNESMYGDAAKADVKMKYVYSLEDAFKQSREQKKPIFFNCFADWAIPCHSMNKIVFSDQAFCDYMNKNFVNLFIDVTQRDASSIAQKYNVKTFAQYLVLDADGNILLRILGGKQIPQFKAAVMRALSPKTSLAGTEKVYQSGRYGKKDLLNYLYALDLAADRDLFAKIAAEYIPMLKPKEYAQKENWLVIRLSINDRNNDLYKYMVGHKKDFEKESGTTAVNEFIESIYYRELFEYALGNTPFDAVKLAEIHNEMQKVELPETCVAYKIYQMAQLRGEQKYEELLDYAKQHAKELGEAKFYLDCSFDFPDMEDNLKAKVITYWRDAAKEEQGSKANRLEQLAREKEDRGGIRFETGTFSEALAKAKSEKKFVFIDCYTAWCGPCKMMANQVFIVPEVGDYFNTHFVNIKMDMEKGEGKDLAKKYGITAYPTMMLLDENGEIVQKILGARSVKDLMKAVSEVSDPKEGYTVSKMAFDKGDRSGAVIRNYTRAMKQAGELEESQINKLVADFFVGLNDKQFCEAKNWSLIEETINDVKSKDFERILTYHDELANQNGLEVVNKKIEKVIFPFILKCFSFEVSEKEANDILAKISSGHYPKDYTLNVLAQLMPMYHKDNKVNDVLDFYEKRVSNMQNPLDRLNIDVLLYHFMEKANAEQIERAKRYAEKALKQGGDRSAKSYQGLMQKLDEIKN